MSVVDLDRARFGHQRADTWGHEVTRSPVKCIPPGERLRQSNEWTDLPSEDPEIRDTVVEHIAWKDRRALHDVQQAEALRQESSRLFDSYHQVQRDCLALEAEKEKVYNAVCVEKYDSAKSHEVCAQIEREVRNKTTEDNSRILVPRYEVGTCTRYSYTVVYTQYTHSAHTVHTQYHYTVHVHMCIPLYLCTCTYVHVHSICT